MSKPFRISDICNRRIPSALPATVVAVCTVVIFPTASYSSSHNVIARASRSLNAKITAHLHLVKAEGSELFEEGAVSGALLGTMQAELKTGAIYTGTFTTHTRNGSIKGHGTATPHGAGRYQSFSGTFIVTGGTGRYARVSGHAGLYGVFDHRTDAITLQTTGKFSY